MRVILADRMLDILTSLESLEVPHQTPSSWSSHFFAQPVRQGVRCKGKRSAHCMICFIDIVTDLLLNCSKRQKWMQQGLDLKKLSTLRCLRGRMHQLRKLLRSLLCTMWLRLCLIIFWSVQYVFNSFVNRSLHHVVIASAVPAWSALCARTKRNVQHAGLCVISNQKLSLSL